MILKIRSNDQLGNNAALFVAVQIMFVALATLNGWCVKLALTTILKVVILSL